jgi:hypothetical protein
MDKLTVPISFKVSPRIAVMIHDKARDEGMDVSELIRKWVFQSIHQANFRMGDYLKVDD